MAALATMWRQCRGFIPRLFIHHRPARFVARSDSLPSDLTNGLCNRLRHGRLYCRIAGVITNLKFVVRALLNAFEYCVPPQRAAERRVAPGTPTISSGSPLPSDLGLKEV